MNSFNQSDFDETDRLRMESFLTSFVPSRPEISIETVLNTRQSTPSIPGIHWGTMVTSWASGVAMGALLMFVLFRGGQFGNQPEIAKENKQIDDVSNTRHDVTTTGSNIADAPSSELLRMDGGRNVWWESLSDNRLVIGTHLLARNHWASSASRSVAQASDNLEKIEYSTRELESFEKPTREQIMKEMLKDSNRSLY